MIGVKDREEINSQVYFSIGLMQNRPDERAGLYPSRTDSTYPSR